MSVTPMNVSRANERERRREVEGGEWRTHLQVVGVLPDVDAEQRDAAGERVLVGHGLDEELLGIGVKSEPAPAANK